MEQPMIATRSEAIRYLTAIALWCLGLVAASVTLVVAERLAGPGQSIGGPNWIVFPPSALAFAALALLMSIRSTRTRRWRPIVALREAVRIVAGR